MSNPREFWCDITDEYDKGKCLVMECHIEKPPEWEKTHRVSEGLSIHVIEKSALYDLEAKLKIAVEALEYAVDSSHLGQACKAALDKINTYQKADADSPAQIQIPYGYEVVKAGKGVITIAKKK